MPFADYADFADCVAKNGDKADPNAYCAAIKAKAEGRTDRRHQVVQRAFVPLEVRAADLPSGVCGRMVGVGITYEVPDAYGTVWGTGCLDMTKRSKVPAGKVGLYTAGPMGHEYGVRSHVGVVRSATSRGNEEIITADLFDTEDGRRTKEYLAAVLASGGSTGLSIGCYVRRSEMLTEGTMPDTLAPGATERYTEVELEEFTITPRPAVPGAEVDAVRQNPEAMWAMFDALTAVLPIEQVRARLQARVPGFGDDPSAGAAGAVTSTPETAPDAQSDASQPAAPRVATEAERARALAALALGHPYHG